ncbi:MAG: CPBP family intramembrane glutamic endopeptidase [Phycisphaerae bacterium]
MIAVALLLSLPVAMWAGQTALRLAVGRPICWRLAASDLPRRWQRVNRVWKNACVLSAPLLFPLLRGMGVVEYYAALLPRGVAAAHLLYGFAGPVIYLALLYGAWTATGNVTFGLRHPWPTLLARTASVPLSAALGATLEELLFRGVLQADLMRGLAPGRAAAISAVAFALAHYVRRVKRYWTIVGHLALGSLLAVSFAQTQSLWLPIGVHAGGIFMIMGARPYLRYTGPAWLVGASIFPYAGAAGVAGLSLLTVNVWLAYGVGP